MENKMKVMKNLVEKLNAAAETYYNTGTEIMSNKEYDSLYDKLKDLEQETGIVLPDSPTQKVGSTASDDLPKERHEYPALSLDKTKDYDKFVDAFRKGEKITGCNLAVLMWKLDGSTLVVTYKEGKLQKLLTRGNGEVGSVITHNAPYVKGLPLEIPYKGEVVLRGEATMSYTEFERINDLLPDDAKYKNPRNLANATVTLMDTKENKSMRNREIWFNAFNLVYMENMPESFYNRLYLLQEWGFNVVPFCTSSINELEKKMREWENTVPTYDIPVDGLVVAFEDAKYADTLPGTGHNPHVLSGYAFKWADETAETTLREIEWSASRTGLLNPVAIFDPVELEGTTVSRASLHNLSTVVNLNLEIGNRLAVYKANKIIPQVAENLDRHKNEKTELALYWKENVTCPCCGSSPKIVFSENSDTYVLKCINEKCSAKLIRKFVHFCSRDCMNIKGISDSTIQKFVELGFVKEFADFWHLDRFKEEIINLEGLGPKSYDNIIVAAEKARKTNFVSFIHALGIPNVGKGQAKLLRPIYGEDIKRFLWDCCNGTDFTEIEGIGEVIADSIHRNIFYQMQDGTEDSDCEITRLLKELEFPKETEASVSSAANNRLAGQTYVITGSLEHFPNRDALKEYIEQMGGKVTGSVSKNTTYLINNDVDSTSGKNKKAKELGIPIISEQEFMDSIAI